MNNKAKGKATPKPRGRKPAAANKKKTPPKRGRKRGNESSEEESDHQEQDGSSSEDEPLAKKTKVSQPPTVSETRKISGLNLIQFVLGRRN